MSLFRTVHLLVAALFVCVPAAVFAADNDLDGFDELVDCDDTDPLVNPDAEEICDDAIDNDCDGDIDAADTIQWYPDGDGDGYGVLPPGPNQCERPAGYTALTIDCDDDDPDRFPGNVEICDDQIDQNCDDRDTEADDDQDEDGQTPSICGGDGTDCDDEDDDTYLGASERCDDGIDQDCNGVDLLSEQDNDMDGEWPDCGLGSVGQDCDDEDPALNTRDDDGDGAASCFGDCDDNDPLAHPANEEICDDGIDNDCSGDPDADPPTDGVDDLDEDGDGSVSPLCGGDDCDDADPNIRPVEDEDDLGEQGATCEDAVDNDCDGLIDNEDDDCQLEPEVDAGVGRQDRYLGGTILIELDGTRTTDGNLDDTLVYTWTMLTDTSGYPGVTAELVTDPAEPVAYLRFSAEPGTELNKWTFDFQLIVSDGVFTTTPEDENSSVRIEVFRPTVFGVDSCSVAAPARGSVGALALFLGAVGLLRRRRSRTLQGA